MNPKSALISLARLFFLLALPLLLMMGAVRLVMSHEFLRFEYLRPGFPTDPYGFTTRDRLDLGNFAIDYLFNAEDIEFLADLRLPSDKCLRPATGSSQCAMFGVSELSHMEDVKLFTTGVFGFALAVLLSAAMLIATSRRNYVFRASIIRGLREGGMVTLALLTTTITMAAVAWDRLFDTFHELFFAVGTWRFPFSATLIRLYPERLFLDAALAIGLIMALSAVLVLIIIGRLEGRLR